MLRVSVIGLGYWGPNLLRNFMGHPSVRVEHVCDSNAASLREAVRSYSGIKPTTDLKEVLKGSAGLVAVATPPETHFKISKAALSAGKHILVSKPFTKTVREAAGLIELAERKGLRIFVDHTFVFHPVVCKIKDILEAGRLGEVHYFDSERVNLGMLQKGVNVIWDLASHDFSILIHLFKGIRFKYVQAFASRHIHPEFEDLAHIMAETEGGLAAHIHASWISPVKIRKTIIGGGKKMLWWDDVNPVEKLKLYESKIKVDLTRESPFMPTYVKGDVRIISTANYEPLGKEVQSIVETLKEGKRPEVGGPEGLEVVGLLEACQRSIEKGMRRVRVES